MMGKITFTIDETEITSERPTTILEAAIENGIEIPTLCHQPELTPNGACRICVVEVAGARTLLAACHTPPADGMVVHTRSPKVLSVRKAIVELMLTAHTGTCVNDINAANCALHKLASDLEVGEPRFRVKQPRFYQPEDANPHVTRDLSKCILCFKCVKACDETAGKGVLSVGYRGFKSKIIAGNDDALTHDFCKDCMACVDVCPTGALSKPDTTEDHQKGAGSA
jgi:NADH dehydrogenase/NADH:ubiquinone oxidoreductase subunit G